MLLGFSPPVPILIRRGRGFGMAPTHWALGLKHALGSPSLHLISGGLNSGRRRDAVDGAIIRYFGSCHLQYCSAPVEEINLVCSRCVWKWVYGKRGSALPRAGEQDDPWSWVCGDQAECMNARMIFLDSVRVRLYQGLTNSRSC
jgi:hypothetical protein